MKAGARFDPTLNGFVATVHTWDFDGFLVAMQRFPTTRQSFPTARQRFLTARE
jgi:hypothetical protein